MKEVRIKSGRSVTIKESCVLTGGKVKINDPRSNGAIRITGKNVEVDFSGVELSSKVRSQKDFKGIGILVEKADNVVIRNAKVSGFKYNIVVRKSKRVLVTDCDTTGSLMKPILTKDKYNSKDWLDIFKEKTWREYGAGIALESSTRCRVQRCESHESVNGLWLVNSSHNYIVHNDLSHNTGWGIWMWKACHNTILFNNCDYNVRCEDPKRYSAGGDSAGIMLSNANNFNLIAHNTFRHSGDGFFLNGALGTPKSNDNVIAFNDGSHSPHNAFESSDGHRNQFIGNIASNSRHGFWCGFSTYNQFIGNIIENINEWGISIEHAFENVISGNEIRRARRGIMLFTRMKKARESRDYEITGNVIEECLTGITLSNTKSCRITGNTIKNCATAFEIGNKAAGHMIMLNNIEGNNTILALHEAKDIDFKDNFFGLKTREKVMEKVKAYKESVLAELNVEQVRGKRIKFVEQPVFAQFAKPSVRKDRKFHYYSRQDNLIGKAEVLFQTGEKEDIYGQK